MRVARRYVVTGRVQGVGFRYFAERAAGLEGIDGWVSNRDDGAVEVSAEGERDAVTRFEQRLRQGPPHARVDDVQVDEAAPSGGATGFSIRS